MKKLFVVPMMLLTTPAFAQATKPVFPVPEISALEGTAALAVVATLVLLAWERRRRAS
ncbi:MAG: VPEID-CTERM sorting domain-containing protein [Aliishimia sp.]